MVKAIGMLMVFLFVGFAVEAQGPAKVKKVNKKMEMPYEAEYSSKFKIGDDRHSMKVLEIWKDFEENELDRHLSLRPDGRRADAPPTIRFGPGRWIACRAPRPGGTGRHHRWGSGDAGRDAGWNVVHDGRGSRRAGRDLRGPRRWRRGHPGFQRR
jgi:hypothetical protein